MRKKIFLIVTLIIALAGCSFTKETVKNDNEKSQNAYTKITNFDYEKNKLILSFSKVPEKVLAVYQSPIEIMLALGLEEHIVATAQLDTAVKPAYQEAFKNIKYYDIAPSKEEVLGLSPDFIFSWYSYFSPEKLGKTDFWINRGINTYMVQNSGVKKPNTLENEYEDILNIGKIFKVEKRAKALIDAMENEIQQTKQRNSSKEKVTAIIVEAEKKGSYRVYGSDTIGGDMAQQLGAELVGKGQSSISKEELIRLNPDVIFSVYYGHEIEEKQARDYFVADASLQNLNAVKNKRINTIVLSEVYSTGIRTLDGIQTIAKGLYK